MLFLFFSKKFNRKHLDYESKLIENILHIPKNFQNITNEHQNQPGPTTNAANSQNLPLNSIQNTNTTNQTTPQNSNSDKNDLKLRYFSYEYYI
jgi:hypothetical protein